MRKGFWGVHNTPYTDMHNLNLDWILEQILWLKERVDKAFVGVAEKVREILTEWKNDGTLKEIIDEELIEQAVKAGNKAEMLARLHDVIYPVRIFRTLNDSGKQSSPVEIGVADWLQGNCKTPNGWMVYRYNSNKYTDNGVFTEYNMNAEKLRERVVDWGHGNSVVFFDDGIEQYILVAEGGRIGGSENSVCNCTCTACGSISAEPQTAHFVNTIRVYRYSTMDLLGTFPIAGLFGIQGLAWDCVSGKLYIWEAIGKHGANVYKLNVDYFDSHISGFTLGETVCVPDLQNTGYPVTAQGLCAYDDMIGVYTTESRSLKFYNLSGECMKKCTIPDYVGAFFMGEIEQITFTPDGTMWIATITSANHTPVMLNQFWRYNIYTGEGDYSRYAARLLPHNIYVGSTSGINPDGTANNPVSSWVEAYILAHNASGGNYNTVNFIDEDVRYNECIYIDGDMNLTINANNCHFNGLVMSGGYAFVRDATFHTVGNYVNNGRAITINAGTAYILDCKCNTMTYTPEYAVYITNGQLSIRPTLKIVGDVRTAVIRNQSPYAVKLAKNTATSVVVNNPVAQTVKNWGVSVAPGETYTFTNDIAESIKAGAFLSLELTYRLTLDNVPYYHTFKRRIPGETTNYRSGFAYVSSHRIRMFGIDVHFVYGDDNTISFDYHVNRYDGEYSEVTSGEITIIGLD